GVNGFMQTGTRTTQKLSPLGTTAAARRGHVKLGLGELATVLIQIQTQARAGYDAAFPQQPNVTFGIQDFVRAIIVYACAFQDDIVASNLGVAGKGDGVIRSAFQRIGAGKYWQPVGIDIRVL